MKGGILLLRVGYFKHIIRSWQVNLDHAKDKHAQLNHACTIMHQAEQIPSSYRTKIPSGDSLENLVPPIPKKGLAGDAWTSWVSFRIG